MKATGIIFSNIYDGKMGELTKKRATASMPFGGRYRIIDFMLSGLVNSGISSVGVLTKYNYRSLLDHLGSGSEWNLNRLNGGLFILPPFTSGEQAESRGKFETMYNAIPFLKRVNTDYVVLCDASVICRVDFEKVIEEHIESGVDITAVAGVDNANYVCDEFDVSFEVQGDKLTEILLGRRGDVKNPVSLGIYVIERTKLIETVEEFVSKGRYSFERDYLQAGFVEGKIKVKVSTHDGYVLRNRDTESYFKNNLLLMESNIRKYFFGDKSPVYTKVRHEVPTVYGDSCEVNDCFIADGCRIFGEAEKSVIFRDVILDQGAKIKNCVIMQGAKISANAIIENAIIEKNTIVDKYKIFRGAENSPVIIK